MTKSFEIGAEGSEVSEQRATSRFWGHAAALKRTHRLLLLAVRADRAGLRAPGRLRGAGLDHLRLSSTEPT